MDNSSKLIKICYSLRVSIKAHDVFSADTPKRINSQFSGFPRVITGRVSSGLVVLHDIHQKRKISHV